MAEVCELLDIKKTKTTAYHPQSDGMVERFNQTLEAQLSKLPIKIRDTGTNTFPFLLWHIGLQCMTYWKHSCLSPKLQRPWQGPYTVTKRLNDLVYRIQLRASTKPKVVHRNRLWLYSGDDPPSWFQGHQSDSSAIPSNTEDDHEHLADDHEHQLSDDYRHQLLKNQQTATPGES